MPNILVVDDNLELKGLMAKWLQGWGHQAVCAGDCEEALSQAGSQPISLALLDLYLENESGLDIVQKLRDIHPDLPILMISADRDASSIAVALEFGVDDFIGKPIDPVWLQLLLERHLPRKGSPAARLGPYQIEETCRISEREQVYRARDVRLDREK